MSLIVFDYTCTNCGNVESDKFVQRSEMDQVHCDECDYLMSRLPAAPHLDWDSLAMGSSASPEAIAHWVRKHQKQKAKEEKSLREHGDYGPRPGAD
jgi:hypothetical protein